MMLLKLLAGVITVWLTIRGCQNVHKTLNPRHMQYRGNAIPTLISTLLWFTVTVAFTQWAFDQVLVPAVAGGVMLVAAVAPWHRAPRQLDLEADSSNGPVLFGTPEPIPVEEAAPGPDEDTEDGGEDERALVTGVPSLTDNEQEQFAQIVRGYGR